MDETNREALGVGKFVRGRATGRLGVIREVREHGYVIKFGGRGTTFLRFDDVVPDRPAKRR